MIEEADFDDNLQINQEVQVRWTNCGRYFTSRAIITKLNKESVRVKLCEKILDYPEGQLITVPRWSKATTTNGVFPAQRYLVVDGVNNEEFIAFSRNDARAKALSSWNDLPIEQARQQIPLLSSLSFQVSIVKT